MAVAFILNKTLRTNVQVTKEPVDEIEIQCV